MPSYIVKCDPDQDFYVMWSSIVDAPTAWGSRTEIEAPSWLEPAAIAAERFHRADEYGTSAQWGADQPGTAIIRPYAWDSDGFIYLQQGLLPRARLRELCERLEKDDQADVTDMLEPFEDD
jgi:hypothetical protein